jgi:hypothetical protein
VNADRREGQSQRQKRDIRLERRAMRASGYTSVRLALRTSFSRPGVGSADFRFAPAKAGVSSTPRRLLLVVRSASVARPTLVLA